MKIANFPQGVNEIRLTALTQWDKHQKIAIYGLDVGNVFQVHFCNVGSKQAIVRIAYENGDVHEVDIPNRLLQEHHTIYAYVYLTEYEVAKVEEFITEGEYYIKNGDAYTKVTLPREWIGPNVTYYKQAGSTVKTIVIPVMPRKKPDDYIDEGDPTSEELIDELLRYCNNLGVRLDYYTAQLADYRSRQWVYTMTTAEYEALVAANKVENNVLYGIEDQELYEVIKEGIEKGDITIGTAAKADVADYTSNFKFDINNSKIISDDGSGNESEILASNVFELGYENEQPYLTGRVMEAAKAVGYASGGTLESKINELMNSISSLTTELGNLKNRVGDLENEVEQIKYGM